MRRDYVAELKAKALLYGRPDRNATAMDNLGSLADDVDEDGRTDRPGRGSVGGAQGPGA